jgi:hypothetical protein
MNIDWNKIKKEYPKSFDKCIEYLNKKYGGDNFYQVIFIKEKEIYFQVEGSDPIYLCYCDIEKFFDDIGIIINIAHNLLYLRYDYIIYSLSSKLDTISGNENFRQEAKEQAIYKAFEILEKNSR